MILKDCKGVIIEYCKVVKDWLDNVIVLNNLVFLELEEGMLSDVEKYVCQVFKVIFNVFEIVDILVQILVVQGEMEDVKEVYDGIVDDNVCSDEVFFNYVELLLKMDLKMLVNRCFGSRVFEI